MRPQFKSSRQAVNTGTKVFATEKKKKKAKSDDKVDEIEDLRSLKASKLAKAAQAKANQVYGEAVK